MNGIDLAVWLSLLFSSFLAMQLGHQDLGVTLLGMSLLSVQIAGQRRGR